MLGHPRRSVANRPLDSTSQHHSEKGPARQHRPLACPFGATAAMPVEGNRRNPSKKVGDPGRADRRPQGGRYVVKRRQRVSRGFAYRFSQCALPAEHGSRTTRTMALYPACRAAAKPKLDNFANGSSLWSRAGGFLASAFVPGAWGDRQASAARTSQTLTRPKAL